jgi:hypothetical protein
MKAELGSVMQHQHRAVGGGKTLLGSLPVTFQDVLLGDTLVGEKAIGGFGVGPILAGQGNAFSETGREPLQKLLQALAQPLVRPGTSGEFLVNRSRSFLVRGGNGLVLTRNQIG